MSRENAEKLLNEMGCIEEAYVRDYLEHTADCRRAARIPKNVAAAVLALAIFIVGSGTVYAAATIIRHYFSGIENEGRAVVKNYSEIAEEYGVTVGQSKQYGKLEAVCREVVAGEEELLLQMTYTLTDPAEATYGDGRITPADLPFRIYVFEGEKLLLSAESGDIYTELLGESEDGSSWTILYDVNAAEGTEQLVGKELTVCLAYSVDADGDTVDASNAKSAGFVYTFLVPDYYGEHTWKLNQSYRYDGHEIALHSVREKALYLVLDIECDTDYTFLLCDDAENIYRVYPYRDNDANGYWFVKPPVMGKKLTLQVIDNRSVYSEQGEVLSDEYEVLYEIPIELD